MNKHWPKTMNAAHAEQFINYALKTLLFYLSTTTGMWVGGHLVVLYNGVDGCTCLLLHVQHLCTALLLQHNHLQPGHFQHLCTTLLLQHNSPQPGQCSLQCGQDKMMDNVAAVDK